LKDLALGRIINDLRNRDIVKETFSEFTVRLVYGVCLRLELISSCRYDDIRAACVTRLVYALQNDTAEKTTWTRVCEIIDGHFKGEIEHATGALSSLWETLSQDGHVVTPPNVESPVRLFPTYLAVRPV